MPRRDQGAGGRLTNRPMADFIGTVTPSQQWQLRMRMRMRATRTPGTCVAFWSRIVVRHAGLIAVSHGRPRADHKNYAGSAPSPAGTAGSQNLCSSRITDAHVGNVCRRRLNIDPPLPAGNCCSAKSMPGSKRETLCSVPSSGNSPGRMQTRSWGVIMFRHLCVDVLVAPLPLLAITANDATAQVPHGAAWAGRGR